MTHSGKRLRSPCLGHSLRVPSGYVSSRLVRPRFATRHCLSLSSSPSLASSSSISWQDFSGLLSWALGSGPGVSCCQGLYRDVNAMYVMLVHPTGLSEDDQNLCWWDYSSGRVQGRIRDCRWCTSSGGEWDRTMSGFSGFEVEMKATVGQQNQQNQQ